MALNFSIVDGFVFEYRNAMQDKTLLRHERYRILAKLRDRLWDSLRDSERFESELSTVIESIGKTSNYGELREYHEKSFAGIRSYFHEEKTVVDVHDLFRIIRDALTIRVLRLVEEEMKAEGFGAVPSEYCWIGLGSEGRDEQTFVTDQDNMLIFETDKESDSFYYEEFSKRVVEGLYKVGFEKCKGGIMPSNDKWRGSVEEWKRRIEETLTQAKGTLELLDLIILTDARVIDGKPDLFKTVLDGFFSLLKENNHVMKTITESSVMMPTALGFFGKFKVETGGENKGKFNIKLLGWSPLIMSVRALSLHERLYETNTLRRIKRLRDMNMIGKDMEEDLVEAYLLFVRVRVMNQLKGMNSGMNFINPDLLGNEEAGRLRKAMRSVEGFQKYIHEVILFGQPI